MIKKMIFALSSEDLKTSIIEQVFNLADQLSAEVGLVVGGELDIALEGYKADFAPLVDKDVPAELAKKVVEEVKSKYPGKVAAAFSPLEEPVIAIPRLVKEWEADMVVVGRHNKSFFKRMTDQGRAKRLMHEVDVPFVVISGDEK